MQKNISLCINNPNSQSNQEKLILFKKKKKKNRIQETVPSLSLCADKSTFKKKSTYKNPAYWRHQISRRMLIKAPIQKEIYKDFFLLQCAYCNGMLSSVLQWTSMNWIEIHCSILGCIAMHCTTLHCTNHQYNGLKWNVFNKLHCLVISQIHRCCSKFE